VPVPGLPGRRRSKPRPFSRPVVELGRHGKSWQSVSPRVLDVGDVIEGAGALRSVPVEVSDGVFCVETAESSWYLGETVTAFTRGKPRA
jgi:hypothetical protein